MSLDEARFEQLATLEDGWLNGVGRAPAPAFVQAVRDAERRIMVEAGVPAPHVYPTEDGGLQLEWDAHADVEFSPCEGGYLVSTAALALSEDEELEDEADLDVVISWFKRLKERTS